MSSQTQYSFWAIPSDDILHHLIGRQVELYGVMERNRR
jgi:hypothetical protein